MVQLFIVLNCKCGLNSDPHDKGIELELTMQQRCEEVEERNETVGTFSFS